jgi:protein TonB
METADSAASPRRIRVGANVQQANLIYSPKPAYPPLAKQAHIQGVVRLNAVVSKEGTVENLDAASGHPLLVPAALEAVRQWVYRPTLLNGEPVEVVTVVDVNFTLLE